MSIDARAVGKISIGHVIRETFSVIAKDFKTLGVVVVLLVGAPSIASELVAQAMAPQMADPSNFGAIGLLGLLGFLFGIAAAVLSLISYAAVTYGVITASSGSAPDVRAMLRYGATRFLPVLGVGILVWLGITFGALLLIIPGIIVALMWCAAPQIVIMKRAGIMESLGRSRALTRGNRWRIFGLLAIILVIFWVIMIVFGGVAAASMFGADGIGQPRAPWLVVASPLIAIASALVSTVGGAVLYLELNRAHGGVGAADIASTFD